MVRNQSAARNAAESDQVDCGHVPQEVVQPLVDTKGCAEFLDISIDAVERLRVRAGLPAIDLGFHRPGRRLKHLWRFDPILVREWWVERVQRCAEGEGQPDSEASPKRPEG